MRSILNIRNLRVFILAFLLIACKEKQQDLRDTGQNIEDPLFETSFPDEVGMVSDSLLQMEKAIRSQSYPNIHSVIIMKNNKLVYENYFAGKDEIWGTPLGIVEHHRDSLHDIRSVSKSIVSACIGLAVAQGKIESVNQAVFDFFPEYTEYKTPEKAKLTLWHLLTMTSGLEWNEDVPYDDPNNSEIQMTSSEDPMAFVLSRPLIEKPGSTWNYNGGTTQLLAAIIKKVSGMEIDKFANRYLFLPMEIDHYEWTKFPGTDLPAAASGLRLTSRDLLKFGLLYQQEGQWQGNQLISKEWIQNSTQAYINFGRNNNLGYGYQFWILNGIIMSERLDYPIVAAFGNGNQRIYLDKKKELIVVITAGNYNLWRMEKDSEALMADFIYPAILSTDDI